MNIESDYNTHRSSDVLDALLYDKFRRRHRIVIGGDRGVLTATDGNLFVGLQLLHYSLTLSHDIRFAVVDLGMDDRQLRWCRDVGILVIPMPDKLILPDRDTKYWQTWNKPLWIEHSPFKETLWLDADVVVRGSLEHPFTITSERPFLVECGHAAPGFTSANPDGLYTLNRKLRVPERANVFPNAGVIGVVVERDRELLDAWKFAVEFASDNPRLSNGFSWYDQGALIWALESTRNTSLVRKGEWTYNCPGRDPRHVTTFYEHKDVFEFLESLPRRDSAAIRHYTSVTKPWTLWDAQHRRFPIDLSDVISNDLRVLVLGHSKAKHEKDGMRSYLELVNLNDLEIGEHQRNEIAESRIFLDPKLMDRFEGREYVGLASERWNRKYGWQGVPLLEELHHFRDELAPDRVLVAGIAMVRPDWVHHLTETNPGIGTLLAELEEFTGMPLLNGQSFWANNFICHRDVFQEYLQHFRKVYDHFYGKYKNRFPFTGTDTKRTPAYFYEAVTVHYFANRRDLKINRMVHRVKMKCS